MLFSALHFPSRATVLQFKKELLKGQKLTLYLYINIEVFLGYGTVA